MMDSLALLYRSKSHSAAWHWQWDENYRIATRYSLFVDYRVQLESLPSVYGQLSHTPKSLKRLYGPVRVVCLGSIEQKVDDCLATNIPEQVVSNEEIAEAYRRAIEVLWKFLKTHLKLDRVMSKNLNAMTMQIYAK
jgi:IS4 transposase